MRKLSNDYKNFIWNVIGLTAYCGISFLLLVVVNNINEPNIAGIFSYSFSICTLFFYVSLFFNRTFQIASNKYSFNQFLGTRLITSLISIIAIVIFSLISGFSFNKVLIIFFIMLYRIVDAISDCFYGYFQDSNKLYIVGISYTIKAIFSLIVFVISEILTKNLNLSLLLFLIINLLVLLIYDIRQYKNISKAPKIEYDFSCFLQITKKTFPIFILQFISIYLVNSPKYIITYFTSDELQAIFGVLIIPATILSLVGNYLIQPFVKKLNDYRIEKKYEEFNGVVKKILIILFGFGFLTCLIGYLIGVPVLNVVFNHDFTHYKLDMIIIIIASILNSAVMILSGIYTLFDKNKIQVLFFGVCSLIGTLVCYCLVRKSINVIHYASISYLLSYLLLFMIFAIFYLVFTTRLKNKKGE